MDKILGIVLFIVDFVVENWDLIAWFVGILFGAYLLFCIIITKERTELINARFRLCEDTLDRIDRTLEEIQMDIREMNRKMP